MNIIGRQEYELSYNKEWRVTQQMFLERREERGNLEDLGVGGDDRKVEFCILD